VNCGNAAQLPSQADKNRLGRLELHAGVTPAAVRSGRRALVAAAAAPPSEAGTEGGFSAHGSC
jgi:hypothetical protein